MTTWSVEVQWETEAEVQAPTALVMALPGGGWPYRDADAAVTVRFEVQASTLPAATRSAHARIRAAMRAASVAGTPIGIHVEQADTDEGRLAG